MSPTRSTTETVDPTNVIEVEFPQSWTAESIAREAVDLARNIYTERELYRQQWIDERRWARRLERDLIAERRARFPVNEPGVLAALRAVAVDGPVRASVVAAALFPHDTPDHSAVIRVGRALAHLERSGSVSRIERRGHDRYGESIDRRHGYQWEALDA